MKFWIDFWGLIYVDKIEIQSQFVDLNFPKNTLDKILEM